MKFFDFDATIHIRAYDIEANSIEEAVLEAIENGDFEVLGKTINRSSVFYDNDEDDE